MLSFILLAPIFIFPILWVMAAMAKAMMDIVTWLVGPRPSSRRPRRPAPAALQWDDRMFR